MIHPKVFFDNKHRASHAASRELAEMRKRAKAEGKVGILTLTEKNQKGWVYVIHSDDLVQVLRAFMEDLDYVQAAVCDGSVLSEDTHYIGPTLQTPQTKKLVATIGEAVQEEKKQVRVQTMLFKRKTAKKSGSSGSSNRRSSTGSASASSSSDSSSVT